MGISSTTSSIGSTISSTSSSIGSTISAASSSIASTSPVTSTSEESTPSKLVCTDDQECFCPQEEDHYEFEWQNFVYGILAGLGIMVIIIILYQIVFYKEKKSSKGFDLEMTG